MGVLDANRSSSVDLCFKRDGVAWSRTCLPIQSTRQGFSSGRSGRPFKRGHSIPPRATGYRAHPYKTSQGLPDWQSRDPLPNAERLQGPNLYEYVQNRPINFNDPDGRVIPLIPAAIFLGAILIGEVGSQLYACQHLNNGESVSFISPVSMILNVSEGGGLGGMAAGLGDGPSYYLTQVSKDNCGVCHSHIIAVLKYPSGA